MKPSGSLWSRGVGTGVLLRRPAGKAAWVCLLVALGLSACDSGSGDPYDDENRDAGASSKTDASNDGADVALSGDAAVGATTGTAGDAGSSGGNLPGDASSGTSTGRDTTRPSTTQPEDASAEANDAGPNDTSGEEDTDTDDGFAIPNGVLLYVYHHTPDEDWLMALDLETGDEAIITDLTDDGSDGWEIKGFSISPDRRRIALASLYNPTQADVATGLATRAIWTLAADGSDFRRLTPTFTNDSQGRTGFQYAVDSPEWTADGSHVVYNFGTYWWEGTNLEGGSFPWVVAADGNSLPTTFETDASCSVLRPVRNPITGEFLLIHSVCVPGQSQGPGFYLYPPNGGTDPTLLVASSRVEGGVDVSLERAAWLPDGSGFLFLGGIADTEWRTSLLLYNGTDNAIIPIVFAPPDGYIDAVTLNGDATKIVYCARDADGNEDLRLLDLRPESPVDTAITTDGKSCDPSF